MEKRVMPVMVLWLLMVLGIEGVKSVGCPSICTCSTWFAMPKASCTGQHLYSVYTGVSNIVQALDLSNNSIIKLEDRQLSRVGLTKLKYLNLSTNAIAEIELRAFDDLKNLSVLDLSYNRMDYIAPDTFYDVRSLRILHLAGNKFNLHVPKLHSDSITKLDLSGCRIDYLPDDTFKGLHQLRKLDITNNHLTKLAKDALSPMPYLQELVLGKNLWLCDAKFISLKLYMRTKKIDTDQVCERPTLTAQFEKYISLKAATTEAEPRVTLQNELQNAPGSRQTKDPWEVDSWHEIEETVEEEQQVDSGSSNIFANAIGNISPFWFLLIGFLLGSGATMVVTYLWLSTTISCLIPRIRRADAGETNDASSQRVSLLRHLWTQENIANSEESNSGTSQTILPVPLSSHSCPGTPPPPYREVMLHRNLYPRAAMVAVAQQRCHETPAYI
ncbi:leucine-rich repeat-containing protein 24-like [Phymastichus coffea]|uniref:leucine-rich repeat-containing protein 24-like n=1 Tax=Phymastichus coffea TaxID=108790 RepID=UPI00273CCF99|nr:leucine-rich repeat-containing protein 24-like [Phymastichus coffea]